MMEQIHPVDIIVGSNVRKRRSMKKMSQTELGERIGITFQQIQKYEKGTNRISASRLHDIATVFGVDVADFFVGTGDIAKTDISAPLLSVTAMRLAADFEKIKSQRGRLAIHNLVKAMIESDNDAEQDDTGRHIAAADLIMPRLD
jgi:transcriptional regulator with XRE-family HTH domain